MWDGFTHLVKSGNPRKLLSEGACRDFEKREKGHFYTSEG